MARTCRLEGCDEPVRGRRRYCSDDHAHQAKLATQALNRLQHGDRYNEDRREARAADSDPIERADREVIDYTAPGAASRPPSFSGIAAPPAPQRRDPGLSDGRVVHPSQRVHQPDVSHLTNAQRRNHYYVEREMVRQQRADEAEENEATSWDALVTRNTTHDRSVHFPPADNSYAGVTASPYAHAILGQSVRRPQPRKPEGIQRRPHII